MSGLLLDTHVLLWWDLGAPALGRHTRRIIENTDAVYVSAISEWELAIKAGLAKIRLERTLLDAVLDAGFEPLPLQFEHAQAVKALKPIHKDPFDRLLVATAMVEGLTIVSGDGIIKKYPVRVIDARH